MLFRSNSKFSLLVVVFVLLGLKVNAQSADDILDDKLSPSVDRVLYQWLNSLEGFPDTVKSIVRLRCDLDSLKQVLSVEIYKSEQLPKALVDSLILYIKGTDFSGYPHSAFNYTITYHYTPDNTTAAKVWLKEKFTPIIAVLNEKYKIYQSSRSNHYPILLHFRVILKSNGKPESIEWLSKPDQNGSFLLDAEDYLKTNSFKNNNLSITEFQYGFELK